MSGQRIPEDLARDMAEALIRQGIVEEVRLVCVDEVETPPWVATYSERGGHLRLRWEADVPIRFFRLEVVR